jgi:hypothetical protein
MDKRMAVTCSRCGDNKILCLTVCENVKPPANLVVVDTFMWSGDELCTKCFNKEEQIKRKCCGQTFIYVEDELCSERKQAS